MPGGKEECLVLLHWTAQTEAVLVPFEPVIARREIILGVEIVVSDKLKRRSVKLVASTARGSIHHAATASSEPGAVTVALDAELLDSVRIRKNIRDLGVGVFVDPAIQVERSFVGARSAGRYKRHFGLRPRCALPETS